MPVTHDDDHDAKSTEIPDVFFFFFQKKKSGAKYLERVK